MDKFIKGLCMRAGEDEAFDTAFKRALTEDEEICSEFIYHMEICYVIMRNVRCVVP